MARTPETLRTLRLVFSLTLTMAVGTATCWSAPTRHELARQELAKGNLGGALRELAALARDSRDPALIAEYAYALAASGLTEATFAQLDRAFQLDPADKTVRFVAAAVFAGLGVRPVAQDLQEKAPTWLAPEAPRIGPLSHERPLETYPIEVVAADYLMWQKRHASAAYRLSRLTATQPDIAIGWMGYAVALQSLEAFRAQAHAVRRHAELRSEAMDAQSRRSLAEFASALEQAAESVQPRNTVVVESAAPPAMPESARSPALEKALGDFRSKFKSDAFAVVRLSERDELILEATETFLSTEPGWRKLWLTEAFDRWSAALQAAGAAAAPSRIQTVWRSGGAVWARDRGVIDRIVIWTNGNPP